MNEDERYVANSIRLWVWSGFYTVEEMTEMVDDILEDDCNGAMLKRLIEPQLQNKREAQQAWPTVTSCDRLDKVFERLHQAGICALGNAGYTMSDGFSEVAEATHDMPEGLYHGFCFYHGQDVERAIEEGGLMIAFGAMADDPAHSLRVAQKICDALKTAGFDVAWDGTVQQRIEIPGFQWLRRS
ncbi:hypothetical protein PS3A_16940 [Pseudomonas sp. 3A(2025)]